MARELISAIESEVYTEHIYTTCVTSETQPGQLYTMSEYV